MKDILNSHSVASLKAEIKKSGIKGYSKLKKGELVDLMAKNASKFGHLKKAEKKGKVYGKPAQKVQTKKDRLDEAEGKKKGSVKKSQSVTSRLHEAEGKKKAIKKTKEDNLKKAVGISREQANKMDFFALMKNLPGDIKRTIGGEVKKTALKGDMDTGYYYTKEKGKKAEHTYKYPAVLANPIEKGTLFETRGGFLLKDNLTGKYHTHDGYEVDKYGYGTHDNIPYVGHLSRQQEALRKGAKEVGMKIIRGKEAERQKEIKKGNLKEQTGKAEGFALVKRQFTEADKKAMLKEDKRQSTIDKYKPKVKKFLGLPLKEQNKLLKNKIVEEGQIGTKNKKGGFDYEPHKHSIQMTKTLVKLKSLKFGDIDSHRHSYWKGEKVLAMLMSRYPHDFKI
jgi:hypothetical protein